MAYIAGLLTSSHCQSGHYLQSAGSEPLPSHQLPVVPCQTHTGHNTWHMDMPAGVGGHRELGRHLHGNQLVLPSLNVHTPRSEGESNLKVRIDEDRVLARTGMKQTKVRTPWRRDASKISFELWGFKVFLPLVS